MKNYITVDLSSLINEKDLFCKDCGNSEEILMESRAEEENKAEKSKNKK